MKNRIKNLVAGVCVCLFLAGCGTDKALVLTAEGAREMPETEALSDAGAGLAAESGEAEEPGLICVHVCGAVNAPGVVMLPAGSRGWEAVEAADGFAENAARDAVNLAQKLEDGEQLYIPNREEAEEFLAGAAQQAFGLTAEGAASNGLVNINKADAAQLMTLPGIGEVRANAVIAYRQTNGNFGDIEDIMQVPGIKQGAFEKIKDKITVK